MNPHPLLRFVLLSALGGTFAHTSVAQCGATWQPGDGVPGADGEVLCSIRWDPDGSGPLGEHVVIGGSFATVGLAATSGLAMYDPASGTWSVFGGGVSHSSGSPVVFALTVTPSGDLVIGGFFAAVDGVTANNIATFDGSTWLAMAAGSAQAVTALSIWNGQVVAAGDFTGTGHGVSTWDGTGWMQFGGAIDGTVKTMAVLPGGDLAVGGGFFSVGGILMSRLARWDGSAWFGFPTSGLLQVDSMVEHGGSLYAGGQSTGAKVRRWSGASWQAVGLASDFSYVRTLTEDSDGELVACGDTVGGGKVARLVGASWLSLGTADAPCNSVVDDGLGNLIACGYFADMNGVALSGLARFDGSQWSAFFTNGTNGPVADFARGPNGDVYAVGSFTRIGGVLANRVARWDGSAWSPMGGGITTGMVTEVVVLPGGEVVVGGTFTQAGAAAVQNVAMWDGVTWAAVGSGTDAPVNGLDVAPSGDLIAGCSSWPTAGNSTVLRWDGTMWLPIGNHNSTVRKVAVAPSGQVFAFRSSQVDRWDGSAWSLFANGTVRAMVAMPDGNLMFGGSNFTPVGGPTLSLLALWDGTNWHAPGFPFVGIVEALALLPDDSLVAGGSLQVSGGQQQPGITRFDGLQWSAIDGGVDGVVDAIIGLPDGLMVGGVNIRTAGGASPPATNIAHLQTNCAATVVDMQGGCVGSGGSNTLANVSEPWIGTTFSTTGTGLPTFAFVMAATGFQQQVTPLASVLPQGLPGCDLLVSVDILEALISNNGDVTYDLPIPNMAVLGGLPFFQQLIAIDVDMSLNILEVTSSNAIAATVGAL